MKEAVAEDSEVVAAEDSEVKEAVGCSQAAEEVFCLRQKTTGNVEQSEFATKPIVRKIAARLQST